MKFKVCKKVKFPQETSKTNFKASETRNFNKIKFKLQKQENVKRIQCIYYAVNTIRFDSSLKFVCALFSHLVE